MTDRHKWHKVKKSEIAEAEALLRLNERWCMNACSRFINRESLSSRIWALKGSNGKTAAVIVYAKQSLLPVLSGQNKIPPPRFLSGLFGALPVHSVQGRKDDAEILESALKDIGLNAKEQNDYDAMCIDRPPKDYQASGPEGLAIRKPALSDMDDLAALHAAYEREEVLPALSQFNPAASRLNTERLFRTEQMLVAELGGRVIGKINTNAAAFTRFQVGGVYVLPAYRGKGIARRMAGEFIASLVAQGRGISLFVKKSNPAARRVYQRIGFEVSGNYRISYY